MTQPGTFNLDTRPRPVLFATVLLGINIALLLGTWVFVPQAMQSYGGQALSLVFWSWMAWACFFGHGWCRWVLIVVVIVFLVSSHNSGMAEAWKDSAYRALSVMWNHVDSATFLTKVITIPILISLYLPDSRQWFRSQKQIRHGRGNEIPSEN